MIGENQFISCCCQDLNGNGSCEEIEQINQWCTDNSILEVDKKRIDQVIAFVLEENIACIEIPVI